MKNKIKNRNEKRKDIIEKNMQLINWVYKDRSKHPYIKERRFKIEK